MVSRSNVAFATNGRLEIMCIAARNSIKEVENFMTPASVESTSDLFKGVGARSSSILETKCGNKNIIIRTFWSSKLKNKF